MNKLHIYQKIDRSKTVYFIQHACFTYFTSTPLNHSQDISKPKISSLSLEVLNEKMVNKGYFLRITIDLDEEFVPVTTVSPVPKLTASEQAQVDTFLASPSNDPQEDNA